MKDINHLDSEETITLSTANVIKVKHKESGEVYEIQAPFILIQNNIIYCMTDEEHDAFEKGEFNLTNISDKVKAKLPLEDVRVLDQWSVLTTDRNVSNTVTTVELLHLFIETPEEIDEDVAVRAYFNSLFKHADQERMKEAKVHLDKAIDILVQIWCDIEEEEL